VLRQFEQAVSFTMALDAADLTSPSNCVSGRSSKPCVSSPAGISSGLVSAPLVVSVPRTLRTLWAVPAAGGTSVELVLRPVELRPATLVAKMPSRPPPSHAPVSAMPASGEPDGTTTGASQVVRRAGWFCRSL